MSDDLKIAPFTSDPQGELVNSYPPGPDGRTVMERLRQVHGVTWEWSRPDLASADPGRRMGVIAQDVQAVFPDLVAEVEPGVIGVDYAGLIAPVIEAVKELDARLARIEAHLGTSR